MTRYQPLWQQAGSYTATLDRALLLHQAPYGEASGLAPSAVANTMQIQVPAGRVIVPLTSGQGGALCRWDQTETVTLAAAPPSGQSRIDRVVCQVRDNALDAGGNNDFIFAAVAGVPAATNPAAPAVPANAFLMCDVTVPGAAANLNTATITDRRLGPWLTPAFSPGWGPFAGFQTPQYRVDGRGRGWARGTASYTGTISTGAILTLPVPMSPAASERYAVAGAQTTPLTGVPFVTVTNTGQFNLNLAGAPVANPFVPLDTIGGWDAQGPFW